MKSDMKNEFEEYISKLTTSICKDIFLEEFKNLCNQMSHDMETYEDLSCQISETKAKLDEELVVLKNDTLSVVQNMTAENNQLKGYTANLFNELKEQHFSGSEQYRAELDDCLESKKVQIQEMLESQIVEIGNTLEGIVTKDDIQLFVEEIRNNARQSRELASFINSTYKDEIEKSIVAIVQQTDKAQEEVHEKIVKHVEDVLKQLDIAVSEDQTAINKYAANFQESVNKQVIELAKYYTKVINDDKQNREDFLKRQEDLIAQIGPKDEKIEHLNNRISEFEKLVKQLESDNAEKNKQLESVFKEYIRYQEELDKKRCKEIESIEKRAESLSWKMYMTFTNSILMCSIVMLIFLQQPWETFGIKATVIATAVFVGIIILFIVLKRVIAKAIVKKQVSKNSV